MKRVEAIVGFTLGVVFFVDEFVLPDELSRECPVSFCGDDSKVLRLETSKNDDFFRIICDRFCQIPIS